MNKLILLGLATVLITACNPSTQNQQKIKTKEKIAGMIEITTFKINQHVKKEDFKQSALAMQKEFLEKQNGFIKRVLSVSQDNLWTDIVFWRDQQSAEKAIQLAQKSTLFFPFMKKIESSSVKMNLSTPILFEE